MVQQAFAQVHERSQIQKPIAGGVLQRKCDKCRKKKALPRYATDLAPETMPPDVAVRSSLKRHLDHDFSLVQTHSDHGVAGASPAHLLTFNGGPVANLWIGHNRIFINGPGSGTAPNPSSPVPAPRPPPTGAATTCPTDIKVAGVGQGNDRDFGRTGPITGWGGFAQMEVSDPGGRTWDGTAIRENLRNIKNTCGDQGNNACSNRSGQGGGTGSTFEVGKESNFLGLGQLPAARNRFYDIHAFMKKGSSLLHMLDQPSCEIQCEQFYECSGRRFGPDFAITYLMTRDAVPRIEGGSNAVTRVEVRKATKTTPSASPTAHSAGSTP